MTKKEFQDLAERYASGTCSDSESLLFEYLYESLQKQEKGLVEIKDEERLRVTIRKAVLKRASLYKRIVDFRVAASIVFVLTLTATIWLFTKTIEQQWTEITTSYGEMKELALPDGSKVVLNAASTIRFPKDFKSDKRLVELEGEAFFDVVKDSTKPFLISCSDFEVRVLGTSFNVKSYRDEEKVVTVATGKVRVDHDKHEPVNLSSDDQLVMAGEKIQAVEVNARHFIAWTEGVLNLNGSLAQISRTLERAFGVEIVLPSSLAHCEMKGTYKKEELQEIIKSIAYVLDFNYTVNENQILISGEGCNKK